MEWNKEYTCQNWTKTIIPINTGHEIEIILQYC